jgi:hypothetical protein
MTFLFEDALLIVHGLLLARVGVGRRPAQDRELAGNRQDHSVRDYDHNEFSQTHVRMTPRSARTRG